MAAQFLILGPPGVGKSSLINMFAGGEVASTGTDAAGVTKEITPYRVSVGLSSPMTLLDVPGYGGNSGNPFKLSIDLRDALAGKDIHGILVCVSMTNVRFEMANHFISELVNEFIEGSAKWDKVVFVLTMENVAKMVPSFPKRETAVPSFIKAVKEKVPECPVNSIVCVGKGVEECGELIDQLERLAPLAPLPKPTQSAGMGNVFVKMMEKVWNIPKEVVIEELKKQGECFAVDSIVHVQGVGAVKMKDLRPGDMLQCKSGFTRFVGFFHVDDCTPTTFVVISAGSACVQMTPKHLIMVARGEKLIFTPAGSVLVGDTLLCSNGSSKAVCSVSLRTAPGYLAPLTASGNLYVNDVLVSCYVELPGMTPDFMHMMMAPLWLSSLTLAPPDKVGTLHWYPAFLAKLAGFLQVV